MRILDIELLGNKIMIVNMKYSKFDTRNVKIVHLSLLKVLERIHDICFMFFKT